MGVDLGLTPWVAGLLPALGAAGFVTVLVIFMLLEQRDMRDRIVALAGDSHLATTTKAFDDAAARLSRYLLMQTLVNAIYGVGVGAGLWLFGVPYPLLWGVVAAVLRFIPYVGPWIAAVAPIAISLAAVPGWTTSLYVIGWFVVLELVTNLVLETVFYAGAAGVTQVSLHHLVGVLDVAVGTDRIASGDATDRVPGRPWPARAGPPRSRDARLRSVSAAPGDRVLPAPPGPPDPGRA